MALDKAFFNVIMLGFAFMLVFTAFQTWGNVQKTMLESMKKDGGADLSDDSYYSLAIIYVVFSVFNWSAPSVISVVGPRLSMLAGAVTYLIFVVSFAWPQVWLLYLVSVLLGIGAAMIWTGQGNYLSLNSSEATISRNSGLFWAMLQFSMFIGNIFVYFVFQGKESIDKTTRQLVIWTLSAIALGGTVLMVFFPKPPPKEDGSNNEEASQGPLQALKGAVKLFFTKDMMLLNFCFLYTGLELGFWSGVYGSCISFTEKLPNRKELVGISGIFIGLGEVIGGAAFGILGSKTRKWGRDPIVIGGFILHVASFFVIFINIPNDAPFKDTSSEAFITSSAVLAIMCSFLLGLGDACYNTQIYSLLGGVYSDNSASAFAIFKFSQSVAAAASFFYAQWLVLYGQIGILLVFSVIGTCGFVWVEWSYKKKAANAVEGMTDSEAGSTSEKPAFIKSR